MDFRTNSYYFPVNINQCVSGALGKLGKAAISNIKSVCPSVYPHVKTGLTLDGFS